MQQLEQEVNLKAGEVAAKEEDIVKARLEISRSARELEDLKKKVLATEKAKEELVVDRSKLKSEIAALKTQISEQKLQVYLVVP